MKEIDDKAPERGYILIWIIRDYNELGGGTYWATVDTEQEGLDIINEQNRNWGDKFELHHFSHYNNMITIEPVNIVTEYKVK